MKHWLVIAFMLSVWQIASAQNVIGKIVDNKNIPLGFANIVLLSFPDSAFVEGMISDIDGVFVMSNKKQGVLKVSSIGYQTLYCPYDATQIGTLVMHEDMQMLEEVVVSGHRPVYRLSEDGMMTSIQNSVLSKAGTANDVLKHIPGLQEKDGNFFVFGKGAPVIYINGRLVRDMTELDNLKSEDIKDVELITNPGARYDSTVKSVIRIKTVKLEGEGFGFDVRSSYYRSQNTDLVEQLNINYRYKKIDIFGMFKYNRNESLQKSKVQQTVFVDTLWNQNNVMKTIGRVDSYQNIGGVNYAINSDHSVGGKYTLTLAVDANSRTSLSSVVLADGVFYDHWSNNEWKKTDSKPSHLLNAYYHGVVGKVNIDIETDMLLNGLSQYSRVDEVSQNQGNREIESVSEVRNQMIASKIVVTWPWLGGKVNVGGEYIYTKRADDYVNVQQIVPTSYSLLRERTVSPFLEFSRMTPIGILSGGVRYEWVQFDYYENEAYKRDQSRTFGQLFPNLSLGTKLGKVQMQLGYTTKVKRPTYKQLSNNIFYGNRYTLQTGNPLLKSEIIHDISCMGMWKFLQFMLSYQQTKNAIIYGTEQMENNPAITKITYINLSQLKNLTAFVSLSPKLGVWAPQLGMGIRKQWLNIVSNNKLISMNTPMWMGSFNNSFKLPLNFTVMVDMAYQGKGDYQNVSLTEWQYTVDASILKTFFKDQLSIQLKATDIFNGFKDGNMLYNKQMYLYQFNKYDKREIGLTLRYKFNMGKSKYKGTGVGKEEINRL